MTDENIATDDTVLAPASGTPTAEHEAAPHDAPEAITEPAPPEEPAAPPPDPKPLATYCKRCNPRENPTREPSVVWDPEATSSKCSDCGFPYRRKLPGAPPAAA
jgi:hypothetical protein